MKLHMPRVFRVSAKVFLALVFAGLLTVSLSGARSSSEEDEKKPDVVRLFTEQDGDLYGGVIARTLAADQSVWVNASQSGQVEVDIYRAEEKDLFQALSYKSKDKTDTSSESRDASFRTAPFAVDQKKLHRLAATQTISVNGTDDRVRVTLPLKEPGIYYARAWQGNIVGDAFFVVSNTATQVKEADQKLIAWTVDTRTGRHVSEGSVEVYSLSGKHEKTHDASIGQDGVAEVAFTEKDDILVARSGGEVTVTPLNFADHSDRWFVNDWQSFAPTQTVTRSFLFTDRPLYQPGDTILFKSILRDDHDAVYGIPDGAVRVRLYKGGYWDEKNIVFDQVVRLSSEGALDGSFRLPEAIETGDYSLSVEAVTASKDAERRGYLSGRTIYGSTWIEVQYYRKPEFGLDIEMEKDQLIAGDTLRATVSGSYFSGQPIEGETLNYAVYASDYYDSPYDNEARDDSFENSYRFGSWYGRKVSSGTITLGADGKAIIEAVTANDDRNNANSYGGSDRRRDTMPQVYSVEVSVDGDDQHSVFENSNALVMPGDFSIRQKEYAYGSKEGEKMSLPVVLRDNPGSSASVSGREISVKAHMTRWVKNENATEEQKKYPWSWPYHREERDFDAITVRTNEEGEAVIDFVPPEEGSYEFVLKTRDDRGNELSRTLYAWVSDRSGAFYRGSESNQSKILTLQVDSAEHHPGEKVNVSISSLMPNREVWLTFVRDHVRRYQAVFIEGNSTVVSLPLEENDIPSIYLSGTVFDSTSISTDQVEVKMNSESKEMHIDVQTDKERYKPGDTVSVEVSAKNYQNQPIAGEVTLWAVDKALFELMDQNSGDIFQSFWFPRYDNTETAHSLQGLTYSVNMAERGGCFSGDTEVLMADGTSRAIRDVRVGDRVATRRSERDSTLVSASVLSTHELQEDGYLLINGSVKVTPEHKLFVNGAWKAAGDMVIGDQMTGSDGNAIPVRSLEWNRGIMTVYNLTVEDAHSFFAGGILAHNDIGGKDGGARSRFVDTAYWNPRLRLGTDGKARVTFKLPDNTTTWVLSAVGADTLTRVGQTKHEIVVSKDVIVRTILPNEMRIGDSILVSSMVHNTTDTPLDLSVSASFNAGSIEDGASRSVSIAAHAVEQVTFKVKPEQANEEAKFSVEALPKSNEPGSDSGDSVVLTVPVVAYGFAQNTVQSAFGPTTFALHWGKDDDMTKRRVSLDIASDLFGTLPSAMKYLLQYPYGCVEQTTSRFVPVVIARQYPDEFGDALKNVESSKMIAEGVKHLHELQNDDGSFGFWHDGKDNPFITAYVAEYLVAAKSFGIETGLIDSMLEKLQTYVKDKSEAVQQKLVSGEKELREQGDWWNTVRYYEGDMISLAFAKSVLGISIDPSETHPGKKLGGYEKLPPDILALAVLTNAQQGDLSRENGSQALLAMAHQDSVGALSWVKGSWTGYYASSQASTAMAIRALVASHIDREIITKAVTSLNTNRGENYWGNTFGTAQTIRALTDFHRVGSSDIAPDFVYRVVVDGKEVVSDSMKGIHGRKTVDLDSRYFLQPETSIQVLREGAGDVYSTLSQESFSVDRMFPGTSDKLVVKREYRNLRELNAPIAVGDRVQVILTVDMSGASFNDVDRLVIDDTLPSGLIPVNDAFKNEQIAGKQTSRDFSSPYFFIDQYKRNGAVLTAETSGMKTFRGTYTARAVNAGDYAVPPASAALMYTPEYNGYSPAGTLTITEEKLRAATKEIVSKNDSGSTSLASVLTRVVVFGMEAGVLTGFLLWNRRRKKRENANHTIDSKEE